MKNQELNLLFVFDAIMTEGSITRAAERLGMTQPAVSNAVARMRELWNDPLFVKKGRQIEATAFASSLWQQVRSPMHELASAVNTSSFDPSESRRKFRIALGDNAVDMFWLPLTNHLAEVAPNVDVYAMPFTMDSAVTQLREAQVDLALGPLTHHDRSLRSTWLFETKFVLAMRKDHPLAGKPVKLDDYLEAKHLLVSPSGDGVGFVDVELQRMGLRRRVAVTINHFSGIPKLLLNSDLLAIMPQFVAGGSQYRSELWLTEPPIELEPSSVYLMWHTRHDRDGGLHWMRNVLESLIKCQWSKCSQCVKKVVPSDELETLI